MESGVWKVWLMFEGQSTLIYTFQTSLFSVMKPACTIWNEFKNSKHCKREMLPAQVHYIADWNKQQTSYFDQVNEKNNFSIWALLR